jgi:hypothetical protein
MRRDGVVLTIPQWTSDPSRPFRVDGLRTDRLDALRALFALNSRPPGNRVAPPIHGSTDSPLLRAVDDFQTGSLIFELQTPLGAGVPNRSEFADPKCCGFADFIQSAGPVGCTNQGSLRCYERQRFEHRDDRSSLQDDLRSRKGGDARHGDPCSGWDIHGRGEDFE